MKMFQNVSSNLRSMLHPVNLLPVKSSQLPVDNRGSLIKAVDDGMKKLVNKMKNKDRETIFIFSSDNGAVQIFDNPDKVRGLRTLPL